MEQGATSAEARPVMVRGSRRPLGARPHGGSAPARVGRWTCLAAAVLAVCAPAVAAQELRGRVVERETEMPVAYAGIFALDAERDVVTRTLADSLGRFRLELAEGGEYTFVAQRLGYFETESPLFAVGSEGVYALDIELRPEPLRIDPLLVTVRNEDMERWYTRALGVNPNSIFGFRAIQGARLEEARMKAVDNSDMLRWLYIPVSHGVESCLGHRMPAIDRNAMQVGDPPCGKLYIDGFERPVEHLETIDRQTIALVVQLGTTVELFTYGFDWSKPSRPR